MGDLGVNDFMAKYCPGCGALMEEQPIGWDVHPLNDDVQAWSCLCVDCFKKAYPHG
jgi:hypothetical protein